MKNLKNYILIAIVSIILSSALVVNAVSLLMVPQGGTGAGTFTDGGILLGSGTGAITALGAAANGQIPVGDGTTDPVLATIGGGRSLTTTNGVGTISLAADAELYTDQTGTYIEDPAVESLNDLFWFMNDITITYVWCKTDTGTVTLNLEDGSDNNILSAELVCDVGGQTSCASGCDVNTINVSYDNITAKTEDIDYDASAVASSPTKVSIQIGYTIDD